MCHLRQPGWISTAVFVNAVLLLFVSSNGETLAADENSGINRPNIVLLLADDLGYGELGCQGNPQIPTPHIDSLAANGVRFRCGYVTAAYCSPSRAGVLTGCYQSRFGYEQNPTGARNEDPALGLPLEEKTLARRLHDAGYATGLVGKWHLGGTARFHPLRRGFDEFFGFLHEGHFFVPPPYEGVSTFLRRKTLPNGKSGRWGDERLMLSTHMGHDEPAYDANNPILRGGQPVEESAYLTDAFTREACDFIARNQDRPFFLYLAYNAVHSPLQGADAYMQRFAHIPDQQRRIFAAMLANLDDSVGEVLQTLDAHQLTSNTIVIFLSDNGGPTRELTSSNAPLRGEKGDMYEGGIRVPFLMQWPGQIPAGQVEERPIISLDLFPTCLAAAEAELPAKLDGVNLLPYLAGEQTGNPHVEFFWRQQRRTAFRRGDWKIVRNPRGGNASWELFNLKEDLAESRDLSAEQPEKMAEMLSAWEAFVAQLPQE